MAEDKSGNGQNYSRFYAVVHKAQQLLADMEAAVRGERGCSEIFNTFAGVRDLINELEDQLLALRLGRCFLPQAGAGQEIINAAIALATKRHGALIAIERNQDLSSLVAAGHGTPLEAKLSATLLEAIFYPGAPLHDGGVIISQNRIIGAGCVFPLSEKNRKENRKNLGTRHRAGLGLSEATDALVLVISEETGQISLASEGRLYTVSSPCDLHHRLVSLSGAVVPGELSFCDLAK